MSDDLAALAADAYLYGFPLVFGLQMAGGQADMGMIRPGPFNTFSHAPRLPGPDDRFVSINNDRGCPLVTPANGTLMARAAHGPTGPGVPSAAGRPSR